MTTSAQFGIGMLAVGTYRIDPAVSSVKCTTRHLFGLATVHVTVPIIGGMVDITNPFTDSTVTATLDAAGFRSGRRIRDRHVRSPLLLDTATYPQISFASTRLGHDGDRWVLRGALTAHGRTHPVELVIVRLDLTVHGARLAASTRLDRYAFGLTRVRGMVARHLDVTLDVHLTGF